MNDTNQPASPGPESPSDDAAQRYRDQIARLTRAMVFGDKETCMREVDDSFGEMHVALAVDGNLDKRFEMVKMHVELVVDEFDNFNPLLSEYVETQPLKAYGSHVEDAEQFLEWLTNKQPLTPEQRDLVCCQRSRYEIEEAARGCRAAHVRFHELASLSETLAEELESNASLVVHLNPLRLWTTFESNVLLDEEDEPPVDILFFAVGRDIRTAVLEPNSRYLIEELSEVGPCTLDQWALVSKYGDREDLVAFCRDSSVMQLVAFS